MSKTGTSMKRAARSNAANRTDKVARPDDAGIIFARVDPEVKLRVVAYSESEDRTQTKAVERLLLAALELESNQPGAIDQLIRKSRLRYGKGVETTKSAGALP